MNPEDGELERATVTWREFKERITTDIEKNLSPRMCRGQSASTWRLQTSYHRYAPPRLTWETYFQILPKLADWIGIESGTHFDLGKPFELASFLAFAQHYGFPTPLLDWTQSPYIAAWFAFSGISDRDPKTSHVSVYFFDFHIWQSRWTQVYDFNSKEPHVTILAPFAKGNRRQFMQQGSFYLFTNVEDVEAHIESLEKQENTIYLEKLDISVSEKQVAMRDLASMGITAHSLFGGVEGICRYFRDLCFQPDPSDLLL